MSKASLLLDYAHSEWLNSIVGYQEKAIHPGIERPKSKPLKHPSSIIDNRSTSSPSNVNIFMSYICSMTLELIAL